MPACANRQTNKQTRVLTIAYVDIMKDPAAYHQWMWIRKDAARLTDLQISCVLLKSDHCLFEIFKVLDMVNQQRPSRRHSVFCVSVHFAADTDSLFISRLIRLILTFGIKRTGLLLEIPSNQTKHFVLFCDPVKVQLCFFFFFWRFRFLQFEPVIYFVRSAYPKPSIRFGVLETCYGTIFIHLGFHWVQTCQPNSTIRQAFTFVTKICT